MAMWLFTDAVMQGRPIRLFNDGQMLRDFTYIDDVVEAVVRLIPQPPVPNLVWSGDAPDPATSLAPWHVYNIGNSQPVEVTEVVRLIEESVGMPAVAFIRQLDAVSTSDTRVRRRRAIVLY
jgi:UDP-glucuronate 4-epimerase